jgi:hypothetical protein
MTNPQQLTRASILAVQDLPRELVEVPEWGGAVYVRAMTALERDAFEASFVKGQGKRAQVSLLNVRAKLVVRTIVDEQGNRIFEDGDAEALGAKSASAVNRAFEAAARLSGITEQDEADLMGESGGESSEPLRFDSPATSASQT